MAEKRKLEQAVLLAKAGKWKPPALEEEENERDSTSFLPSLGYGRGPEEEGGGEEEEEEEDPVEMSSYLMVRGELRFSQKLRLKAETREIYHGTKHFRSLTMNESGCEKYGWTFRPNKESMEAWKKQKPELKFTEF